MNDPHHGAEDEQRRIVVAITGASGAVYPRRVIRVLAQLGHEVHLIVSPLGRRLLHDELGMEGVDLDALSGGRPQRVVLHNAQDVGASLASGSFRHRGMLVAPCSSNTLSAIAQGRSGNLIHRAAHVALKERRPLVLVHREMPLSLIDIRNMAAATEAGAILAPASPAFYLLPRCIDDLVDFVAARCLDLLGVEHGLSARWTGKAGSASRAQPGDAEAEP